MVAIGGGGFTNAVYDPVLKAPKCGQPGSICDSGTLLNGRDTISGGAEPNQPNTINNSCADGTNGSYHSDESIDAIKVSTLDGSNLAPGKTVRLKRLCGRFRPAIILIFITQQMLPIRPGPTSLL